MLLEFHGRCWLMKLSITLVSHYLRIFVLMPWNFPSLKKHEKSFCIPRSHGTAKFKDTTAPSLPSNSLGL